MWRFQPLAREPGIGRDARLMPRCAFRVLATAAFSATSAAFFPGRQLAQVQARFASRFAPPLMTALTCSHVHFSPAAIFRVHLWHLPPSRSNTRRRTRGGTGVSGVLPIHSGTERPVI